MPGERSACDTCGKCLTPEGQKKEENPIYQAIQAEQNKDVAEMRLLEAKYKACQCDGGGRRLLGALGPMNADEISSDKRSPLQNIGANIARKRQASTQLYADADDCKTATTALLTHVAT